MTKGGASIVEEEAVEDTDDEWPVSLNEDEFSEDAMVAAAAESAEFHRARTMAHLRGRRQTLALANGSLNRLMTVTLSSASTVAVPQSLPRLVHQPHQMCDVGTDAPQIIDLTGNEMACVQ